MDSTQEERIVFVEYDDLIITKEMEQEYEALRQLERIVKLAHEDYPKYISLPKSHKWSYTID